MVQVCVSQNLTIGGGKLGLAPWSVPKHVVDKVFPSTGDGAFGRLDALPGKVMMDGEASWTNDAPVSRMVLLRLHRESRTLEVGSPNYAQIRDRFTYKIGGTAEIPDPSSLVQSQFGASVDVGADSKAVPFAGVVKVAHPASIVEDWIGPVPPGESVNVRYRCILWTPPPWSDNTPATSRRYNAFATAARLQLIAFPTPDMDVLG